MSRKIHYFIKDIRFIQHNLPLLDPGCIVSNFLFTSMLYFFPWTFIYIHIIGVRLMGCNPSLSPSYIQTCLSYYPQSSPTSPSLIHSRATVATGCAMQLFPWSGLEIFYLVSIPSPPAWVHSSLKLAPLMNVVISAPTASLSLSHLVLP